MAQKAKQPLKTESSQQQTVVARYREAGEPDACCGSGLVKEADTLMAQGNGAAGDYPAGTCRSAYARAVPAGGGISNCREAYVMTGPELGSAEQFSLIGCCPLAGA